MRIAFTTTFDANDVHNWSGTPYYMSRALQAAGTNLNFIGSLKRQLPPFFKIKKLWKKILLNQRDSPRFNIYAAKHYSQQVTQQLKSNNVDAILSPLVNPIAYLDCKAPIVLWTDALYAALVGFYFPFFAHSVNSIVQGNTITAAALSRCQLTIFSSQWAANTAMEIYGVAKEKVKVVPFGANIETFPTLDEVKQMIKKRDNYPIKLLFLAKSWQRKGGDIALGVAKALHEAGYRVQLTIVGVPPPSDKKIPSYVKWLGFVSKHNARGNNQIQTLLSESHFLIVPSRAEAYGIVFCEANAFAVPCLTTYVGGISTIVRDNINGMTFALEAPVNAYCDHIINVMETPSAYETLALSAYNEFTTRLNWQVASRTVKQFIAEIG